MTYRGDISVSTFTSSLGDKVTNWSSYHIGSTLCRKPLSPGTTDPHVAVPYAQETLQHSPQQCDTLTQATFAHKCLWALEVAWSQSDMEWEVSTDMIFVRLLQGGGRVTCRRKPHCLVTFFWIFCASSASSRPHSPQFHLQGLVLDLHSNLSSVPPHVAPRRQTLQGDHYILSDWFVSLQSK